MSTAACPYCRTKITEDEQSLACEGCGTVHHTDCYAENGGCTIFGCSKAPADEPKVRVSTPELVAVTQAPVPPREIRSSSPPPPPLAGAIAVASKASTEQLRQVANHIVPSIFGGFASTTAAETLPETTVQGPKSRTNYILLGALLGALGAHSFYAGYKKKGGIQLAITLLTLGFASPLSWVWAVIDICTITCDSRGVQFEA
jgi:hypothetical protein